MISGKRGRPERVHHALRRAKEVRAHLWTPGCGGDCCQPQQRAGDEMREVQVVGASETFGVERRRQSNVPCAVLDAGESSLGITQPPAVAWRVKLVDRFSISLFRCVESLLGQRDVPGQLDDERARGNVGSVTQQGERLVQESVRPRKRAAPVANECRVGESVPD